MRFTTELTYDASPEAVHAMLADPAFRARVCEATHASHHEVSVQPGPSGMTVVVDQTQPARGIPSYARRVVGDQIRIVQRETWTGGSAASLVIELPGKPGAVQGSLALAGDASRTVETVTCEVTVRVPMIGGKLEDLVGGLLQSALRAEQRVGRAWLAEG
jgi:uncharacterized protein YndB with AHSA1/START domain